MANKEHLRILMQGGEVWNDWRKEYPYEHPDLSHAILRSTNLSGANLSGINLRHAILRSAILSDADLSGNNFKSASLSGANLRRADLTYANLRSADLSHADLGHADLGSTILFHTNLNNVIAGWTTFGDLDLSIVKGLETVKHEAPSTIGINTIYLSGGNIPESFLIGCYVTSSRIQLLPNSGAMS